MTAPSFARKTTKALSFGKAFHSFLLEPHNFKKTYVAATQVFGHYGLKDAKAYFKALEAEHPDKEILKAEEMWTLEKMREAVMRLEGIDRLLSDKMEAEVSFFANVEGIEGKARLDFLNDSVELWGDFKSMAEINHRSLQNVFWDYKWPLQFAWYRRVVKEATGQDLPRVCVLAVEKQAPFTACIAVQNEDMERAGEAMLKIALENAKKCLEEKNYTSEFPTIVTVAPPHWAFVKGEIE
jgi:hypothetical protein